MMSKATDIYIVLSNGEIVAACTTSDLAKEISQAITLSMVAPMPEEEWKDAIDKYDELYPDDWDIDFEKLSALYPKYSAKEWADSHTFYMSGEVNTNIQKTQLLTNISQWT